MRRYEVVGVADLHLQSGWARMGGGRGRETYDGESSDEVLDSWVGRDWEIEGSGGEKERGVVHTLSTARTWTTVITRTYRDREHLTLHYAKRTGHTEVPDPHDTSALTDLHDPIPGQVIEIQSSPNPELPAGVSVHALIALGVKTPRFEHTPILLAKGQGHGVSFSKGCASSLGLEGTICPSIVCEAVSEGIEAGEI